MVSVSLDGFSQFRWFQPVFIDFQLFYFQTIIIPELGSPSKSIKLVHIKN